MFRVSNASGSFEELITPLSVTWQVMFSRLMPALLISSTKTWLNCDWLILLRGDPLAVVELRGLMACKLTFREQIFCDDVRSHRWSS